MNKLVYTLGAQHACERLGFIKTAKGSLLGRMAAGAGLGAAGGALTGEGFDAQRMLGGAAIGATAGAGYHGLKTVGKNMRKLPGQARGAAGAPPTPPPRSNAPTGAAPSGAAPSGTAPPKPSGSLDDFYGDPANRDKVLQHLQSEMMAGRPIDPKLQEGLQRYGIEIPKVGPAPPTPPPAAAPAAATPTPKASPPAAKTTAAKPEVIRPPTEAPVKPQTADQKALGRALNDSKARVQVWQEGGVMPFGDNLKPTPADYRAFEDAGINLDNIIKKHPKIQEGLVAPGTAPKPDAEIITPGAQPRRRSGVVTPTEASGVGPRDVSLVGPGGRPVQTPKTPTRNIGGITEGGNRWMQNPQNQQQMLRDARKQLRSGRELSPRTLQVFEQLGLTV
jgi:hypothetical protein